MADLAESLEVDRSYINKIETGSSRRVGAVFYSRLLNELKIGDYRALLANPHESPQPAVLDRSEADAS